MKVLRTHDTGHADSHTDWVTCVGSVYGLRRQRRQGSGLIEKDVDGTEKHVATSNLFISRKWDKADGHDAYSGLKATLIQDNRSQSA
jgi:hypothetical protein